MTKLQTLLAFAAAGILGGFALAAAPHAAQAQEFRTGGCTGCFTTQMFAAVSEFASISKVYRLCGTGNKMGTSNACAGAAGLPNGALTPNSLLQDFVVIEGTLKNCGTSCGTVGAAGLGVNGGGFARYYVSANGSSFGVQCANTSTKSNIGFLGIFGSDQTPGGGDDPGDGTGAVGIPAQWPSGDGPTYDLSTLPRAALVACDTKVNSTFVMKVDPAVAPTWGAAGSEFCVVDIDANNNGTIDTKETGQTPGFTTIGALETSDLNQACTAGYSDLPPADFEDPSLNSLTYDQQKSTGAQIFKIVANNGVSALSDPTKKIQLQMPQLEGVFGGTSTGTDACSWADVGGQVSGDATGKLTICYREFGSGTRETFRNTFMLEAKGSHAQGIQVPPGTITRNCLGLNQGGGTTTTAKNFIQNNASGDEAACVAGTGTGTGFTGNIGYVNASRTNPAWYAVPVFGVDPDAQTATQLRDMVRCGMYPYWGPLTGGRGAATDTSGFFTSHMNAMSNETVFNASLVPDYYPLGGSTDGVAFTKSLTAGAYRMKYKPSASGPPFECPGVVPGAVLAHP
jgi:hypothetical protein